MSKIWKWILGILIVLVVAALAVGAVFMVRNRAFMAASVRPVFGNGQQTRPGIQGTPNPQGTPNAPAAPNRPYGFNGQKGPMMPYGFNGRGNRGPMMGRGGFSHFGMFGMPFGMGFFFLFGLLRLVIPLGILALVAFLFYQMGKRAGVNSVAAPASVVSDPAPADTTGKGRKVAKG